MKSRLTIKNYLASSASDNMDIKISVVPIQTDPVTHVYQIEVQNKNCSWFEVGKDASEVKLFLAGLKAAYSLLGFGFLEVPPIPNPDNY